MMNSDDSKIISQKKVVNIKFRIFFYNNVICLKFWL